MITRRKTSFVAFGMILVIVLIFSYYISGLFLVPDISIHNLEESLTQIFLNPFKNYWNEKTLGCMGVGFLLYIVFLSYYFDRYRNFHFGKEYGSEDWGDIKKMRKELTDKDDRENRVLTANMSVSRQALSNNNMLVLASPGQYKTTSVLYSNLLRVPFCKKSAVVLDVKGEAQNTLGNYLVHHGVKVYSLNLKEPWLSDRYNPFVWIKKEKDLIKTITYLHQSVRKPDEMQMGDPFWDDGVDLYLMAVFYYEWLESKDENRMASMNNILTLVNEETIKVDENTTKLQMRMDKLAKKKGENHKAVSSYRKLKEGASETVRSIIIMVNAMLKFFETGDIKRIFEVNDINMLELGTGVDGNPEKPVVLFLVLPDNDPSFNFVINLFYTQIFDVLMDYADNVIHGALPIHVEFYMDEYYSGAKPMNADELFGTVRSRNVSMIPFLQSIAQMKTLYKDAKWEILLDTCATILFLGSGPTANTTHEFISNALGDMTIDTRNDGRQSGSNGHVNENNQRQGRKLMTPQEVKRMSRKDCIVFIEGQPPLFDKKALPWIYQKKEYEEAMKLKGEKGYVHPVKTVYDEETMTYRTITERKTLQILGKEDVSFYKRAAETDKSIRIVEIDEKDFLYMNFKNKEISDEEIEKMYYMEDAEKFTEHEEIPEDVISGDIRGKENWDLSGTIYDCLKRYAEQLSDEELEEIILGLENGLEDRQIKEYMILPVHKMRQYRRLFMATNRQ